MSPRRKKQRIHEGTLVSDKKMRNGRVLYLREVEITCSCGKLFTCVMTTKPLRYCPECSTMSRAEKRKRDINRVRTKRLVDPEYANGARRKIPYAGYDSKEYLGDD